MGAICGAIIGLTVVLSYFLSNIKDELKRLNDNLEKLRKTEKSTTVDIIPFEQS